MSQHDLLGPALITIGATVFLTITLAYAVMKFMPSMNFKEDEPLPSYTGVWARLIPVVSLVIVGASIALVLTQDIAFLWLLPLAPISAGMAALLMTDLKYRRMPNGIMAALYLSVLVTVPVPIIFAQDWEAFARFGIGFGASLVGCILLRLMGMGGGDLKLIPIIFAALSAISWEFGLGWLLIGWLSCGVWGVAQGIITKSFKGKMPMGPGLITGFLLLAPFLALEPFAIFEALLLV